MDNIKDIINNIEELKSQRKYNNAIKLIQDSLTKFDNDYRLYEELADIYLYQNKKIKASKAIDFALSINKESATWNYLKWFILLSSDKLEDSLKYLEKSNELMPNNAEVLRNLWWGYSMIWKVDRWISILKRALNLSPDDPLITEDLAMALINKGEVHEWNKILEKLWKESF
mgnify:CR=1 FL=1